MLITNAKIYTCHDGRIIENGYMICKNDKIISVDTMEKRPEYQGETLDLGGKTIVPGFIDPHCHIGISEDGKGFECDDLNEMTDPITPHLRAIDGVNPFDTAFKEALEHGVTTVITGVGSSNPIGGELLAMKTFGRRIDDMILKSPVAMKFALGENPKMTYNDKSQMPSTRMGTAALIREQLFKAQKYKIDKEDSDNDEERDPPDFCIKCEALLPLFSHEIKAHFHAHRTDDIFTAIRIANEFSLKYAVVHATEGHLIADLLADEHTEVILGPLIADRGKPELAEATLENPAILDAAGVTLAICTDHPENPIQFLAESAGFAVREGLDYLHALESITINSAKICGIDDRVGSIAVGKDADFCVFERDPLSPYEKPLSVFLDGKPVLNRNKTSAPQTVSHMP